MIDLWTMKYDRRTRSGSYGKTNLPSFPHRVKPLPDLRKIAVPAEPAAEAGRPRHAVCDQGLAPVVPLLEHAHANGQTMALDGGAPVGANADLRKARDFLRKCLCF